MKKKLIIILAAALILGCLGIGAWAAGSAGTQSDPLVAMSYLDNVREQLRREFDSALDEAVGEISAGAGEFDSVSLSGGSVSLSTGTEVLCLEPGATATGTLIDATTGGVINPGDILSANHLYLVADNNTLLSGTGEALVRGGYSLG